MPRRDYIEWQDRSVAIGYLITFRCYGTWLHGDERGSVDRRFYNRFGTPTMKPDREKLSTRETQIKGEPYLLGAKEREVVENAIRGVCQHRSYGLYALNVRTNHVHVVTSNSGEPEPIMDGFKAYCTRALRLAGLVGLEQKVWSRHGSTRYLWTEEHLAMAVSYVVNGQGDDLPKFD